MASLRHALDRLGHWPPWLYAVWAAAGSALSGALSAQRRWELSVLVGALAVGWTVLWWRALVERAEKRDEDDWE